MLSDDVVFLTLSNFAHWDGSKAAVVCTVWQSQWNRVRRSAGMLDPAGHRVGAFEFCQHVVAKPGGGAIVSNYGEDRLEIFSPEGESQGAFIAGPIDTPGAVALLGDERNTAWVICEDNQSLVCVQLGDAMGEDKFLEPSDRIADENMNFAFPEDLALSPGGDFLLVLIHNSGVGEVLVLNSRDGSAVGSFGGAEDSTTFGELHSPRGLAVHGNYCFVADTYNQRICVFIWRSGTWVRCFGRRGALLHRYLDDPEAHNPYWCEATYEDERKGTGPGEFIEPVGVAVHGKMLYVSELAGRRIQVMRLPDDILDLSSEPQVFQIIPAPGGHELGGICVDGERLWCVGPHYFSSSGDDREDTYVSLFSPYV